MTAAALRQSEPADQVAEVAEVADVADVVRLPRQKRGRPSGSDGPLAMWLKPQIRRFKAQGASCTNVFRSLSVVEGGNSRSFFVSPETADAYLLELGVDLAGIDVTLSNFRKIWGRTE